MKHFLTQYWFPIALALLLLLAVPGVALFALNLFGYEKAVNRWLTDTFQLSYHLPVPWWSVLGLLLLPLAILLLYFLKLKRRPLAVPSTFLWKKSIEDLHVNSFFQWLRENVLLLLQILTVIAVIYGVMAFHLHGRTSTSKHYILMLDNSASMAVTDVAPNRLEQAKQEALKEIDAAGDDDFGMVIEFSDKAQIKQSYTSNRDLLRRAVKNIHLTQRPTRIEEALSLADSLANPLRSTENAAVAPTDAEAGKERVYVTPEGIRTEVHLFSDGRFPDLPESALVNLNSRILGNDSPLGNLDLRYHAAGKMALDAAEAKDDAEPLLKPTPESADNAALVAFNARREESAPAEDGSIPGTLHIFLRALNFRDQEVNAEVDIDVYEDGKFKDSLPRKPLHLPARKSVPAEDKNEAGIRQVPGEGTVSFEWNENVGRANLVFHAKLAKVGDKFPLDDEAWLVVGVVRKTRVLIVGNDNEVLQAFFQDQATEEVAEVAWISPQELSKETYHKPARNGTYDLVIFDRCGPAQEQDMPRSNTLFIGHPPPPWKLRANRQNDPVVEKLENPHITGWDNKHPLLRYLIALHEIGISEAFRMDVPQRSRLIETDRNAAVLVSLDRGPFTDLVLTFPLIDNEGKWNTDWPQKPSFPLFLRNVLYFLGNISDAATEERLQPGGVKTLWPESVAGVVARRGVVTDPEGAKTDLVHAEHEGRTDFAFGATARVGPYQVNWDNGIQRSFAVNLLDPEESNVEPRSAFRLGSVQVGSKQESSQPREIWKWFALLALLVLLAEWYIYNRRIYV